MNRLELEYLLENSYKKKLEWEHVNGVFIIKPDGLPKSTKWGEFQFNILKPVSQFNQRYRCICGGSLHGAELHHAILSRKDVMGCKGYAKTGIHTSLNTFEICHKCHLEITREKSIRYLAGIYGNDKLKEWYNNYPMTTRSFRIEFYLPE